MRKVTKDLAMSSRITNPGNLVSLLISSLVTTMIYAHLAMAETTMAADTDIKIPFESGTHDLSIDTDFGKLRYSVHVPEQLARDGTLALILVLHYRS